MSQENVKSKPVKKFEPGTLEGLLENLRTMPMLGARQKFKSNSAARQVAEHVVRDLHEKGVAFENIWYHLSDFQGTPIAVSTEVDRDKHGIYVEFDIGFNLPNCTITERQHRASNPPKAMLKDMLNKAMAEDEQD